MPTLTYGKIFQSMFTGSMCGAGAKVFALMSYVITFMQPDKNRVEHVRLPVTYLSKVIGEKETVIQEAIDYLCKPDPASNSPDDGGARLVYEAGCTYRVVNGQYYRELKDEEDRLRKDAERAARYRERQKAKRKAKQVPLPGEAHYVKGIENGTHDLDGVPIRSDEPTGNPNGQ